MGSKLGLGYIWGAISGCHYLWVDSIQENYLRINSVHGNVPENGQYLTECMTVSSVQQNAPHCVDSVQQNTPDSEVASVQQ